LKNDVIEDKISIERGVNISFVNLHVHSNLGSLLDGYNSPEEIIERVDELGQEAVAITEHGTMSSFVRFYKEARERDIKPIIGVEMYVADDMHNKNRRDEKHLVLLAKNNKGLENLYHLVTVANEEGFYYKPRIDFDELKENSEGLIAMSACLKGVVPYYIKQNNTEKAKKIAKKYKNLFGDDFYIEIMTNKIEDQYDLNEDLVELARDLDIKLVATNDVHYTKKEHAEIHDVMLAINSGDFVDSDNRSLQFDNDEFYLKDETEVREGLFRNPDEYTNAINEAIESTNEIAEKCNTTLDMGGFMLPDYEVPKGNTQLDYLEQLTTQRLFEFAMENDIDIEKYSNRLEHELDIIEQKGYEGYFLIVHDFIEWAKENGVMVGPGRGSAGSSLVSYLLNIIDIDPIKYDLLFSRFINPERESLADIDLDLSEQDRHKVFDYIKDKYGKDSVASICTFGSMAAKGSIKDVARTLGINHDYVESKITNKIETGQSIEEALEDNEDLQKYRKKHPKLFKYAIKLEGRPRHRSTHACATVITPGSVEENIPLARNGDELVTQTEMHDTEALGLLKMDLLGLKTLDIIEQTIDLAYETYGTEGVVDKIGFEIEKGNWSQIPTDRKEVFNNIYQKGDTSGVFQVESYLFQDILEKMQPSKFEHIIALVSLGRPGPIEAGLVDSYIDRMHGEEKVEYPDPSLEEYLEETYGLMIYQENVMRVAREIAGYSLGEADVLRRAMGEFLAH